MPAASPATRRRAQVWRIGDDLYARVQDSQGASHWVKGVIVEVEGEDVTFAFESSGPHASPSAWMFRA